MNHFINLEDIAAKDLRKILSDAKKRKLNRSKLNTLEIDKGAPLKGKFLIQMFEKSSLRTRLSFYLAIKQLGGGTITLRSNELHLGEGGETLEDTAKILSTYGDGFMLRTDSDKKIKNFRNHLSIPLINIHSNIPWDSKQPLAFCKQDRGSFCRLCASRYPFHTILQV